MDRYYIPDDISRSAEMKEIDRASDVGVDEWGTSTSPFLHQTEALKARIFHGANRVEFSFFGAGKGRKEQPTPESFGKRERLDMRELAEFNEVETTTHATVGIQGLSGLQQGRFSDEARKQAIDEIKRAVHFAAEATTGGAVVFHTGEAPRYLYGQKNMLDETGEAMFKLYPEEEKRRIRYLVDPLTKDIVGQIRDIDRIAVPVIKRQNGSIHFLRDQNGKEIVDDVLRDYDTIYGGKVPLYETDEDGNLKTEVIDFDQFKEWLVDQYKLQGKEPPKEDKDFTKSFFFYQQLLNVQYNLYFGKVGESRYNDLIDHREKLNKALKFYERIRNTTNDEDWEKFKRERRRYEAEMLGLVPPHDVDPLSYLKNELLDNAREIVHSKELAVQGKRSARQTLEVVNRSMAAEDFAVNEFAKSIGEIGIYTWQMSEKAHNDYKAGKTNFDLKNDLYLAPENLFPETYGSHPDELRKLIEDGRHAMKKQLMDQYKLNPEKAENLAKKHIKATFDISHANVWRKYFISKPEESLEDRDKRFNKWLLKKTKELLDDGIIGHVHISDNFGFHDEHLTAGDGNAPIKEFVKQAKEAGLSEFIVESGSFNPMTSLPDTWMHFDSPVYAIHVPGFTQSRWTDPSLGPTPYGWLNFYRSYFGRTEGPRFIVGDYAPSEDFKGAPFYTGMPIE